MARLLTYQRQLSGRPCVSLWPNDAGAEHRRRERERERAAAVVRTGRESGRASKRHAEEQQVRMHFSPAPRRVPRAAQSLLPWAAHGYHADLDRECGALGRTQPGERNS